MTMTFPTGGTGGDFKRVPAGSHIAVCNLIADCGMQPGSPLYPSPKHKLYIRFEIPAERVEYEKDGQTIEGPMTIGSFYTASMNEKATLRKQLESWRGRAFTDEEAAQFDVSAILGKGCMLSVVHSENGGKTYANIVGIGSLPRGVPIPEPENPLLYYDDQSPAVDLDKLPKWLQDKINGQLTGPVPQVSDTLPDQGGAGGGFEDDEIPFAPLGKHSHWIA